jgi:ribulose-bisphosphate carboxylase large chain
MSSDRILATYLVETPHPVERAVAVIAGEQSSGTFVAVPGETPELKARFGARIEHIERLETVETPSLPGSRPPRNADTPVRYQRATFTLSFPFENIGANLLTLNATVCGNLYELSDHSGLKLLDLQLPEPFADRYPGPQFGIEGTRRLVNVYDRPLIGTIIKPSVGLTPQQTADLVRELAAADIDFIKDDELMADPPHSPFAERAAAVMQVINEHADHTGKKIMFAFNVSDELDAMKRHHDVVLEAGGTCIMMSLNSVGLAGVSAMRGHSQLPLHGHRNGWGMLTRCPALGIAFTAYQKLWRLAGVDHLHVNGLQNKFWEPDDSVVASLHACRQSLFPDLTNGQYAVMPVVSSGQWAGQAPETYRRAGTTDLMYLAGGGIMAHPGGPGAGVTAIRQAWEAAVQDIPLAHYAQAHRELREAIEKYG